MELITSFIRAFITLSIYIVMCESEDKERMSNGLRALELVSKVAVAKAEMKIVPHIAIATLDLSTNQITDADNLPDTRIGVRTKQNSNILSNLVAIATSDLSTNERTAYVDTQLDNDVRSKHLSTILSNSVLKTSPTIDGEKLFINNAERRASLRTGSSKPTEQEFEKLLFLIDDSVSNMKPDNAKSTLLLTETERKIQIPSQFEQKNAFHKRPTFPEMIDMSSEKKLLSLSNTVLQDDASNNYVQFDESVRHNGVNMLPSYKSESSEPNKSILFKSIRTREIMPKHVDRTVDEDHKDGQNKWLRKQKLAHRSSLIKSIRTRKRMPMFDAKTSTVHENIKDDQNMLLRKRRLTKDNIEKPIQPTKVPLRTKSATMTPTAKLNINSIIKENKVGRKVLSTAQSNIHADFETTSTTGSEVEIVEDREADRKCSTENGCIPRAQPLSSDAYWAAGSLLTVLLLLTIGVLYTGLLKRRNDFDVFSSYADDADGGIEMEAMNSSLSIQKLLKKIPPHLSQMRHNMKHPRRHGSKHFGGNKYRRLPDLTEHDSDNLDEDEGKYV